MAPLLIYLVIINAIAFLLMLIDKQKARKRKRRISEKVLLGAAVIGGSIGTLAGIDIFRHKTRHRRFTVGVPVILAVQAALLYVVFVVF